MKFDALTLACARSDLARQRAFYLERLGLSAAGADTGSAFSARIGSSTVTFTAIDAPSPPAHIAFNITPSRFDDAVAWLAERAPLAPSATGDTRFHFSTWNADSVYFYDPAGNILELIARHTQPVDDDGRPFDAHHLRCISELGIVAEDVGLAVASLRAQTGAQPYHWSGSPVDFAPIGDDDGLLIIVRRGREWHPETRIFAQQPTFKLVAHTARGEVVIAS